MQRKLTDQKTIQKAKKADSKYNLCNRCLGRIFAKIETGMSNEERGKKIRKQLKKQDEVKAEDCSLCTGLMDEIQHFVELVEKKLKNYEYKTFLIGTKTEEQILEKEKEILEHVNAEFSESIKSELNREIGKTLEEKGEKTVDFKDPDIMVILDTAFDVVNLQIKPVYFYGRYKKLVRDIPQTTWYCKICRGKGCKRCNYTGRLYDTSVEELISKKIVEAAKGDDESFHGCGREDIDVRMLGNGRPFVLEIKNPKVRTLNLKKLQSEINNLNQEKIQALNLQPCDKKEIVRIKNAVFNKEYRAVIKANTPLNIEKLKKAVQCLQDKKICQSTPSRVAHRRADKVRERYVYNCELESLEGSIATFKLETESGTYIKELVSGDNGRTQPNISDLVGIPCEVQQLDVINIKGE